MKNSNNWFRAIALVSAVALFGAALAQDGNLGGHKGDKSKNSAPDNGSKNRAQDNGSRNRAGGSQNSTRQDSTPLSQSGGRQDRGQSGFPSRSNGGGAGTNNSRQDRGGFGTPSSNGRGRDTQPSSNGGWSRTNLDPQDGTLGGHRGGDKNNGGGTRGGGSTNGGSTNGGGRSGGGSTNNGGGTRSGSGSSSGGGWGNGQSQNNGGGRGDRPVTVVEDRDGSRSRVPGRSGTPSYGSNNNQGRSGRGNSGFNQQIPSYNSIPTQANREERVRSNSRVYRNGYVFYNNTWCDDNFSYAFYRFNYQQDCRISPFYYYPHLPGYVSSARINFGHLFSISFRWDDNCRYDWRYRDTYDRWADNADLDYAVRDLKRAFERNDMRALGRLVPRRGDITVRTRWEQPYNLRSDDFYDMMQDMVGNTRTRSYNVIRVDARNHYARVLTEHVFTDSFGSSRSAYHWYTLQDDGYGYQIKEFRTDDNRWDDRDRGYDDRDRD